MHKHSLRTMLSIKVDAEEANILCLNIPMHYSVYPMISGHKNRFAIKFIEFKTGQAYTGDIEFELAVLLLISR